MVAHAQTVDGIINLVTTQLLQPFVMLLFALATILFLWGVVEFLINAGDEEGRDKGKRHIIWGLLGMVIMFGAIGILNVVINFVGSF
jgi:hypothetical protein